MSKQFLLGIVFVCVFLGACGEAEKKKKPSLPASTSQAVPPELLEGTRYYTAFQGVTGVYYGIGQMTKEQASTVAHVEIDFVKDFPIEIREVTPGGRIEKTWEIQRDLQGVSVRQKNRFGLVKETRTCFLENQTEKPSLLCSGSTDTKRPIFLGCSYWREYFNRQRHLTEIVCLNANKSTHISAKGWTSWKLLSDELGREIERRAFDDYNRPVTLEEGYQQKRTSYTLQGRVFEERYFDRSGDLIAGSDGVPITQFLYNDKGSIAAYAYLDENETPTLANHGAHRVEYIRNEDGDPVDWRYVDTGLRQVPNTPQICTRYHAAYNEEGLMSVRDCKDSFGNPSTRDSVYRTTYQYDNLGHRTLIKFYGTTSNEKIPSGFDPVMQGLCAGKRFTYDAHNRIQTETCLDKDGVPFQPRGFYCRVFLQYNEEGFLAKKEDQDCAGLPTTLRAGIASTVYERDAAGRVLSSTYLDASDTPVLASFGYSQERWVYDKKGEAQEESFWHNKVPVNATGLCFDAKMCTGRGGVPAAYHKMKFRYTPSGERIAIDFYDNEETFLATRDCRIEYCP